MSTTTLDPRSLIGDLVAQRPSRSRVFERFALDYCCGGQRPLADACSSQGLNPDEVLAALEEADAATAGIAETDWTQETVTALVNHLLDTHHVYLKTELPRLEQLVDKVAHVHGERHPHLREVRDTFRQLKAELEPHMMKEEVILFPFILQLDQQGSSAQFHCGPISNPISVMLMEHDLAGSLLARLRSLTQDYAPPADACNSYRAMLDGLHELEADTHLHIAKENNILFPRALELQGPAGGGCSI